MREEFRKIGSLKIKVEDLHPDGENKFLEYLMDEIYSILETSDKKNFKFEIKIFSR